MFELFSRYFWLLCIVTSLVRAAQIRRVIAPRTESTRSGDDDAMLLRKYLVFENLPWVVMGLGITIGGVPTLWNYFRPRDGNPWVLACHAVVVAEWIFSAYWVYRRGGAETLAAHPALIGVPSGTASASGIRRFVGIALLGSGAVMIAMWVWNPPLPQFR